MCALACISLCLFAFRSLYTSRNSIASVVGYITSGYLFSWISSQLPDNDVVSFQDSDPPTHSSQSCGKNQLACFTRDLVLTNIIMYYVTISTQTCQFTRVSVCVPVRGGGGGVDRFYIALFSTLEQTHCACM